MSIFGLLGSLAFGVSNSMEDRQVRRRRGLLALGFLLLLLLLAVSGLLILDSKL
jgi:hypothetical protein